MTHIPFYHLLDDEVMDRFADKTEPEGECLLWKGAQVGRGYGKVGIGGKTLLAHRVAWTWAAGRDMPEVLQIDHLCRNRLCVNIEHLEPVTLAENMARTTRNTCRKGHLKHRPANGGKMRCRTCHMLGERTRRAARRDAA